MYLKIVGRVEQDALVLVSQGYNERQISERIGVARGTIKAWAHKKGILLTRRLQGTNVKKYEVVLAVLRLAHQEGRQLTTKFLKDTYGLHAETISRLIEENGLVGVLRSKAQAAKEDKTLSLEEAQVRVPQGAGTVIGFEASKYLIRTDDGFIYRKCSSKLYQGDPRNKSGTKLTLNDVKSQLQALGYSYVGGYTLKRKAFQAQHISCGYLRTARLHNFAVQGCPRCLNVGVSIAETELEKWIQSLGLSTSKYRFVGKTKGKEIDILVQQKGVGIEYCGLHWHCETSPQPYAPSRHHDKLVLSEAHGIRLITIFEDEWRDRQNQVRGFLQSVLGVNEIRLGARKCDVVEVSKDEASEFLNRYHIQGPAHLSKIFFGLRYKLELVGVISGGLHHRSGLSNALVLDRLCFKSGCTVAGGSSRLFLVLMEWATQHRYTKIISWSDNRWSQGDVYVKLGFLLEEELKPDYSYVKGGKRFSKQSLRKTPEERLTGKTERQLRQEQGYDRIWDCGKKRWVYDLTKP